MAGTVDTGSVDADVDEAFGVPALHAVVGGARFIEIVAGEDETLVARAARYMTF